MFKRDHHVRVATVLQALDGKTLMEHNCLFGGGTAIVLSHGEYRESVDIDFLVSDLEGYRDLRQSLTDFTQGFAAILTKGASIKTARDIRADPYGIRTMLDVGNVEIKFEIVFESRISLESPGAQDSLCGVPTLTPLDMATSKLLANSDRWADGGVFSRDLIDLAMLDLPLDIYRQAMAKASTPYGDSVKRDLERAIENLRQHPGRLGECLSALKMDSTPEALLWARIRKLLKLTKSV